MFRPLFLLFISTSYLGAQVADPSKHPFADSAAGRPDSSGASHEINSQRLYDFYSRQADHYRALDHVPAILPAYPGLDGGKHGHWGKYNQNNHNDGRRNDIDTGSVVAGILESGGTKILKAVNAHLGDPSSLATAFDPQSLAYRSVWKTSTPDSFVNHPPFRWALSRGTHPKGENWFIEKIASPGWSAPGRPDAPQTFNGYHRYADRIIFDYTVATTRILDHPWVEAGAFTRTLTFPDGAARIHARLAPGGYHATTKPLTGASVTTRDDGSTWLEIDRVPAGATLTVALAPASQPVPPPVGVASLESLLADPPTRWPETLTTSGRNGAPVGNAAYAVDTIDLPFSNPYKATLHLTGIDFDADGSAFISSIHGDVWKVTGLGGENLDTVTWKRFATGLNQPFGVHVDSDGIFVLARDQITRLHDNNGDGEADFYECFTNGYGGYDRSHTHAFGLERTADGTFHFIVRDGIFKTLKDGTTLPVASGVRNCMGLGADPGNNIVLVAPQEGTWTPASMIIEVHDGEFYGLARGSNTPPTIAPPLCFIPRGVDNSTGGMVFVDSEKWGPLSKKFIGLSYGSGLHYLILRDTASGPRPQGATVPLEGEFLAGVVRGAFHPQDGQLYTVGLDGWGDYSLQDGCLHRVRYTGTPVLKPVGFQAFANGLRIDFAEPLDPSTAADPASYFAQQWNYEYASRYGSPEFSVTQPDTLGHDHLPVVAATLSDDNLSVFLNIPALLPSMQAHVRMHLKSADGTSFTTDLYPTLHHLAPAVTGDAAPPLPTDKPIDLTLRVAATESKPAGNTTSGKTDPAARQITVRALGGLQYDTKSLTARSGEPIALTLANDDVMPHNLVIVKPGTATAVGTASFAMLNDPDAGKKHYVPDTPDVVAFTYVINPGTSHTTHFKMPDQPGQYRFICTFPGHWQVMQGTIDVAP